MLITVELSKMFVLLFFVKSIISYESQPDNKDKNFCFVISLDTRRASLVVNTFYSTLPTQK
jgi:hypothetical protein